MSAIRGVGGRVRYIRGVSRACPLYRGVGGRVRYTDTPGVRGRVRYTRCTRACPLYAVYAGVSAIRGAVCTAGAGPLYPRCSAGVSAIRGVGGRVRYTRCTAVSGVSAIRGVNAVADTRLSAVSAIRGVRGRVSAIRGRVRYPRCRRACPLYAV